MSKLKCWQLGSWFNLDLLTSKHKLIVNFPYANYFTELNQIPIAQYKLSGLITLKLQILTNMMGRQRERTSKMAQSSQTWTDQMRGIEDFSPFVWSDYSTSSCSSKTMVIRFMLFFFTLELLTCNYNTWDLSFSCNYPFFLSCRVWLDNKFLSLFGSC